MYCIGIDLGGTIIKIGLTYSGRIIELKTIEANSKKGLKAMYPMIEGTINNLLLSNGINVSMLSGIGLAFPGIVNPITKKVLSTNAKYDDACELSIEKWINEKWDVPFCIDNDARLGVIGEWKFGVAKGYSNVVMMTIGTGIGTGVIIDGTILYGQHFQAGSLGGHFIADYKSRKCSCGNIGCIEALSASAFLPDIIKDNENVSAGFKSNVDSLDFKRIFDLANRGNEDAIIIRNQCMDVWSAGIINYIHAYDPEIVVLSGGVMQSENIIIPYLKNKVNSLAWCPSGKVDIVSSHLDNVAILGVEYLIKNMYEKEKIFR